MFKAILLEINQIFRYWKNHWLKHLNHHKTFESYSLSDVLCVHSSTLRLSPDSIRLFEWLDGWSYSVPLRALSYARWLPRSTPLAHPTIQVLSSSLILYELFYPSTLTQSLEIKILVIFFYTQSVLFLQLCDKSKNIELLLLDIPCIERIRQESSIVKFLTYQKTDDF